MFSTHVRIEIHLHNGYPAVGLTPARLCRPLRLEGRCRHGSDFHLHVRNNHLFLVPKDLFTSPNHSPLLFQYLGGRPRSRFLVCLLLSRQDRARGHLGRDEQHLCTITISDAVMKRQYTAMKTYSPRKAKCASESPDTYPLGFENAQSRFLLHLFITDEYLASRQARTH